MSTPSGGGLWHRNVLLMIVLFVLTLGLYYPVWFMRRRTALNRLDSPRKLDRWPFVVCLAYLILSFFVGVARAAAGRAPSGGAASLAFDVLQLAVGVLMVIQCFRIKDILEDHLAGPDEQAGNPLFGRGVQLSGLMTFFFQIFYLQHIINRDVIPARALPAQN